MSKQHRVVALFMTAVFHLEFVPEADLYKTANHLRNLGITATVEEENPNKIIIEAESYSKALEKLSQIVPTLPDIYRFSSVSGGAESILYEAARTLQYIPDAELAGSLKVIAGSDEKAVMTVVLKDDKNQLIKYQNVVRKIENMGYKVTFADGYRDAGWMSFPAIDVEIPNNVASFNDAIIKLSEVNEVNRFLYNRGKNPNSNEFTVSYEPGIEIDGEISKLLTNGIEVYKVDKLLNKLFIHFPQDEAQNKNKLEQIKTFKGLVAIKNLHQNQSQYSNTEYSANVHNIWLDVPVEILKGKWNNTEYAQQLTTLAKDEVKRLQDKGMIVLHYGLYADTGEVLLPEVVFTYSNKDSPKAEEILRQYKDERSDILIESTATTVPKKKPARRKTLPVQTNNNICMQLYSI